MMEMQMDRDALKVKLTEIFRRTFADEHLNINESMTAADVKAWDSLSHINLILAVERGFNIRLTTRDARSMKNVGDLIELVAKKTV
jgi:acyl carrier protein